MNQLLKVPLTEIKGVVVGFKIPDNQVSEAQLANAYIRRPRYRSCCRTEPTVFKLQSSLDDLPWILRVNGFEPKSKWTTAARTEPGLLSRFRQNFRFGTHSKLSSLDQDWLWDDLMDYCQQGKWAVEIFINPRQINLYCRELVSV